MSITYKVLQIEEYLSKGIMALAVTGILEN